MTAMITVLLPYYNEAAFIAGTLESLIAQTDRRSCRVNVGSKIGSV